MPTVRRMASSLSSSAVSMPSTYTWPPVGSSTPVEGLGQGGLAGAVVAQHHHEAAPLDGQIHAPQGGHRLLPLVGGVGEGQVLCLNDHIFHDNTPQKIKVKRSEIKDDPAEAALSIIFLPIRSCSPAQARADITGAVWQQGQRRRRTLSFILYSYIFYLYSVQRPVAPQGRASPVSVTGRPSSSQVTVPPYFDPTSRCSRYPSTDGARPVV